MLPCTETLDSNQPFNPAVMTWRVVISLGYLDEERWQIEAPGWIFILHDTRPGQTQLGERLQRNCDRLCRCRVHAAIARQPQSCNGVAQTSSKTPTSRQA